MNKFSRNFELLLAVLIAGFVLQGCLKDVTRHTYTIYTPVYKSKAEVRAEIKSSPARKIEHPGKLFAIGNFIFLNEVDKGIHVIDNSNPALPVNKNFISIPGNIDLALKGNILYADLYTDMVTLDVSDPTNIQLRKLSPNVFPFRQYGHGFIADTSRIIVDWTKKDTTVINGYFGGRSKDFLFQATTGGIFTASLGNASVPGTGGSMARFCLLNNYLYTVSDNALNVFNIQNVTNPVFTNSVNIGWGIETIYPFKGNLFIGSQTGMFIYSTSNPQQPTKTGSFTHANACDPVIADDNYAYVTLRSGTNCQNSTNQLDIVDIRNLAQPSLVKTYGLTNPHGLTKKGDYLYICDGKGGLKSFNASNPNSLMLEQHIKGIETYDAIALQNVLVVVTKTGLYQYSYLPNGKVQLLSKIDYQ